MKQVWFIFCIISCLLSPLAGASTYGLSALDSKLSFPPSVITPPLPVTAATNNNNKWAAIRKFHFPLPTLQSSTVCMKPACPPSSVAFQTSSVAKKVLLSAVALRVFSPLGGNSLLAHGIVTSLWLFATPVHGGWNGKCANGYLGATCGSDDCCWGQYHPSSNKCGGTHTFVCNGTPNANKIGCGACCGDYTCNGIDSSTVIGPGSCRGKNSCYYLQTSTIGIQACVGDNSCETSSKINVGYGSCSGTSACYYVQDTTVGQYSCNTSGSNVCWGCKNSNVPSNECNDIADGWKKQGTGNTYSHDYTYYNYCIYCSNCKDKNTEQSCYVSAHASFLLLLSCFLDLTQCLFVILLLFYIMYFRFPFYPQVFKVGIFFVD